MGVRNGIRRRRRREFGFLDEAEFGVLLLMLVVLASVAVGPPRWCAVLVSRSGWMLLLLLMERFWSEGLVVVVVRGTVVAVVSPSWLSG